MTVIVRSAVDPLVHHGRHFGRTVHGLCNPYAVITSGIIRLVELQTSALEDYSAEYVF